MKVGDMRRMHRGLYANHWSVYLAAVEGNSIVGHGMKSSAEVGCW